MSLETMEFGAFFQTAYVTRSLDHAVATVTARHGIRDRVNFSPEMEVYTATDGVGPCHVKVALGWAGAMQVELIEPVSGNVRHYLEVLPAEPADLSPRFHHVCMRVRDWDAARAKVAAHGWTVAYEGGVPGCRFVYIDARDSIGHYVEYLWMSDEMWAGSGGPAAIVGI